MTIIQIAIDGPASSGKSTIAKQVSKILNITYLDTGAMYRAVTLAVLRNDIPLSDINAIKLLLSTIKIDFHNDESGLQRVFLNGEDVSDAIRTEEVTANVSEISAMDFVRYFLVEMQRQIAEKQSIIMDGRDIGTVVLPHAKHKFFLTASVEVRAKRRYKENIEKGYSSQTLESIEQAIRDRDTYDSTRQHSPLKRAEDAILIDTSDMTVDQVVQTIINTIRHEG